ncbi:hypothetical protein [Peribacillus loiseleuriae]|uniref:DUF4825 domain-containing protein n=1 Tax=Peribacillus loiseleuriae TaxID=1679170 RepID=A0A0K9GTS5_9BACI|nr:hypothetical protein [Peribacillus loiseleuriae]KMY50060.1 hypothetical protein AC625_11520 [Peribacillus loiseleuriae]
MLTFIHKNFTKLLVIIASFSILASCSSSQEFNYKLPVATYENHYDSKHFGVSLNFYDEESHKSIEEKYATITIHNFSDSTLDLPRDSVMPLTIQGTNFDSHGEAQLDILTTLKDDNISSLVKKLRKKPEELTLLLGTDDNIYEKFELIHRNPTIPSH